MVTEVICIVSELMSIAGCDVMLYFGGVFAWLFHAIYLQRCGHRKTECRARISLYFFIKRVNSNNLKIKTKFKKGPVMYA